MIYILFMTWKYLRVEFAGKVQMSGILWVYVTVLELLSTRLIFWVCIWRTELDPSHKPAPRQQTWLPDFWFRFRPPVVMEQTLFPTLKLKIQPSLCSMFSEHLNVTRSFSDVSFLSLSLSSSSILSVCTQGVHPRPLTSGLHSDDDVDDQEDDRKQPWPAWSCRLPSRGVKLQQHSVVRVWVNIHRNHTHMLEVKGKATACLSVHTHVEPPDGIRSCGLLEEDWLSVDGGDSISGPSTGGKFADRLLNEVSKLLICTVRANVLFWPCLNWCFCTLGSLNSVGFT